VLTSSPTSFLEGFLVCPPWIAAHFSGDASPSCLSQLHGFIMQWVLDAIRLRS
jgi:hypothetical protein